MKTFLKICALTAVLALPGMAFATVLTDVSGTADCDGFTVTATIHWGTAETADFSYDAMLVDDGGATVAHVTFSDVLNTTGYNTILTIDFSHGWGQELCGTFTATVTAHMEATASNGHTDISDGSFTGTFECTCETPPDYCNYTPGYWKNHADMWPVTELSLGGVTYNQDELLAIMDTPVRGDATIILAYHLIAAKLNVASGSSDSINDAISEADDLLMQYPLFSNPQGDARDMILSVKNELADYNELECPDGPIMPSSMMMSTDKANPSQVDGSWSDLKASYR